MRLLPVSPCRIDTIVKSKDALPCPLLSKSALRKKSRDGKTYDRDSRLGRAHPTAKCIEWNNIILHVPIPSCTTLTSLYIAYSHIPTIVSETLSLPLHRTAHQQAVIRSQILPNYAQSGSLDLNSASFPLYTCLVSSLRAQVSIW